MAGPSRLARRSLLPLLGFALLAAAAPAAATTYCVAPATGCGGGQLPTIAQALSAAHNNAGADDVQLGAAGYTDGPWSYVDVTATNPVTVRGAGQLESQLISLAGGPTLNLVNGNLENAVVYSPPGGVAVGITLGTLSDSQMVVSANGRGVDATGATVDGGSIVPAGAAATNTTAVLADNANVHDTMISTTDGIEVTNPPVAVRRATIVTQGVGLESGWGSTAISDSLIVLNDPTAVGVQGICDLAVGTITIDAANLTITGPTGGGGVAFRSIGGQACGGHIAASSTLISFVGTTIDCAPGIGTAAVVLDYSDIHPGAGVLTGSCSGSIDGGGNFFADPLFATPATLQPIPRFDSPLIDAGMPTDPTSQPTDIRGVPRTVNGVRDVGAFEYGRRAPTLEVGVAPPSVNIGSPATFTATTSDLDLGDIVSVAWAFDDGAVASGDEAAQAFATPGTHSATATATDSAGVSAEESVTVEVTEELDPPTGAPQTTITKQPKRKTTKRKAKFEFSSSIAGSTFECTLDKKPAAACSSPFKAKVKKRPKTHRFAVVAISPAGTRDPSPATYYWKLKLKR